MKKGPRLWSLLTLAFVAVLLVVSAVLFGSILFQNARFVRNKEENLLLAVGRQLAIEPQVIAALKADQANEPLESYTNEVAQIHGLDFVVVMNMAAIRLTHPDESLIGQHFRGGDETEALAGHEHISVSSGTLGESLRGFVPVYDPSENHQQIGVVALGIRVQSLSTIIKNSRQGYTLALLISIAIGFLAASALAFYLKRQLHNLEPMEISRLFEERNAMLEETKDAVVVTDLQLQINLANIAANDLYRKNSGHKDSLVDHPLKDLVLRPEAVDLERNVEQLYRQNGQDYLFSAAPIVVSGKHIGWIAFLRNATESLFVMDQLANTTAYASALQSQSHEFMNKLHVVYGLADLKAYDELRIYLNDILTPEREFSHRLSFLVQNPQIAGFLIGERQKFSERKTQLLIEITPEIPEAATEQDTRSLIDLYRFIHHILLQTVPAEELRLSIHYENQTLETIYVLDLPQTEYPQLKSSFENHYFQQMLLTADAHFRLELRHSVITLQLLTHYKEVTK